MREMNSREKMLFYFSVPVCLLLIYSLFSRHVSRSMERQVAALEEYQVRLNQVRDQIAQIPALPKAETPKAEEPKPEVQTKHETSLFLFREMTTSNELEGVRIVSTDKITETSFRVVVKGEFPAMVRWLTFFEREGGRFSVYSASLTSPTDKRAEGPSELTGTFEMRLKS